MSDKHAVDQLIIVKEAIIMFVISGFWCPTWWSSKWRAFYHGYSFIAFLVLISSMVSQLINIIGNIRNIAASFSSGLYLIPTIGAFCKGMNILVNRQNIIGLFKILDQDYPRPQETRVLKLEVKSEKMSR